MEIIGYSGGRLISKTLGNQEKQNSNTSKYLQKKSNYIRLDLAYIDLD